MNLINNLIQIKNINNETFDFDNKLSLNNSLLIKNCYNLKITVINKINKIIIENSHQILITVQRLIVGLDISKSKYILLNLDSFTGVLDNQSLIPFIELFRSDLYLVGFKEKYRDIKISLQLSNLYEVDNI
jgi:hypothetical protein